MNWAQFKDPVSHMRLAGTLVASWFLTQRWQVRALLLVMTNIFVTEFSEFSETFRKTPLCQQRHQTYVRAYGS